MSQRKQVWVAYASPKEQFCLAVDWVEGMTALDAIEQSGLRQQVELPEPLSLGVFAVKLDDVTQPIHCGDRVEIYRELTINPKDIRRHRAEKNPVGRYGQSKRLKQLK